MNDQTQKKGLGCFGTGYLLLLITGVILAVSGALSYYVVTKNFRLYTAGSGEAIPVESGSHQEYEALVKKMTDFKKAAPGSNITLALTAHDLNVLIANSPEWKGVRGKIRVSIGKGQVGADKGQVGADKGQVGADKGQVGLIGSIPLSSIPNLRDQYFNGAIYFTPSVESRVFRATIQDVTSDTRELSPGYKKTMIFFMEPNLNNRLLGDPVIGTVLIAAETLKIESDALVLTSAK